MIQTKQVTVYQCDNDNCNTQRIMDEDSPDVPTGFHGSVSYVSPSGGIGDEFYACKPACIRGAILAVTDLA